MIRKLHHVGVVVENLDEVLPFYRDILGLPVNFLATLEEYKVKVAMLTIGESQIELVEPLSHDTRAGRFLEQHGQGLYHIGLESDDIVQEVDRLKKNNVGLLQEVFSTLDGTLECVLDPGASRGVLVQLIQPGQPRM